MGCKGPLTYNNCPRYRFNQGTNWPIGAGHGCIGCSEPNFWDTMSPFEEPNEKADIKIPAGNGVEATSDEIGSFLAGATAAAIGIHAAGSIIRAKAEKKATDKENK
jgi:NiFe hydrogenase small subunit HydA